MHTRVRTRVQLASQLEHKNVNGTWLTRTVQVTGDVTLSIDIEDLMRILGTKALRSKTGSAREATGAVLVKATHRRTSVVTDWAKE